MLLLPYFILNFYIVFSKKGEFPLIQATEFYDRLSTYMQAEYGKSPDHAEKHQLYNGICRCLQEITEEIPEKSEANQAGKKHTFLISGEYTPNTPLLTSLTQLGLRAVVEEVVIRAGWELSDLDDLDEMKIGCSGKGLVASSLLESAATCDLPLTGYGLRYQYGYFRQKLVHGFQEEEGDDWTHFGDPWSIRRESEAITLHLGKQVVRAIPYDMVNYGFDGFSTTRLRLWKSESPNDFDWSLFQKGDHAGASEEKRKAEDITRLLYPVTDSVDGQKLFIKQSYFLASASMQDLLRRYMAIYGEDFSSLDTFCAVHINDMMPALAVPELIRLLVKRYDMDFVSAFYIGKNIFSYTNYAESSKALLTCPMDILNEIAPDVCYIILMINEHLIRELSSRQMDIETIRQMKIVDLNGNIDFLKLLAYSCGYITGVSLEPWRGNDSILLEDWNQLFPKRFLKLTGGVSPRQWLLLANPPLSALLTDQLDSKEWITNSKKIQKLSHHLDDTSLLDAFSETKKLNKEQLAKHLLENHDIRIDPSSFITVHMRHISATQRQLLGIFGILWVYYGLKDGTIKNFTPTTYIVSGKVNPSDRYGKSVLKCIYEIAQLVDKDPAMKGLLSVVFVENGNIALRQHLVPATDLSLQLSHTMPQSTTISNLQFLINGAVSLGTRGGSTAAFSETALRENNFIFGKTTAERFLEKEQYISKGLYEQNVQVARVVDALINGTLIDGGAGKFNELRTLLLEGSAEQLPDEQFILHDLPHFVEQYLAANLDFQTPRAFSKRGLTNLVYASNYSSDRTIKEYGREVWQVLPPVHSEI